MNKQVPLLIMAVAGLTVVSSMVIMTHQNPSMFNEIYGLNIPEGVTLAEAKRLMDIQNECFEWNSGWIGDLKTGHCVVNDNVIEPINFWKRCGDLYQKYKYECESRSDGCIDGYVLVQDHWGVDMCYKQEHYDKTLTCCDPHGEFWTYEFTTSGFHCRVMSDTEIKNILLEERND